jgi:hypothetical protein
VLQQCVGEQTNALLRLWRGYQTARRVTVAGEFSFNLQWIALAG